MKDEDEQPSEEELREAEALAAALEGESPASGDAARGAAAPDDALEAAALLRHARAPVTVPPAVEPIVAARAASVLEARRTRGRRRVRAWIATSLVAPVAAAVVLALVLVRSVQEPPPRLASVPPPAPTADLLAAQAEATRGGRPASAALARLELEMRAYRRQYHAGLRRRLENEP